MIDSINLCKYILQRIGPANQLKIQKLVYYIQAFHLAYYHSPFIKDEFQAWVHGPVSVKIWDHYKALSLLYNDIPVPKKAIDISGDVNTEQIGLIEEVLKVYSPFASYQLEVLTHSEQPWKEARGDCLSTDKCNTIINRETMKNFYRSLIDSE